MLSVSICNLHQHDVELIPLHQGCQQFVQHCVHSDSIRVTSIGFSKACSDAPFLNQGGYLFVYTSHISNFFHITTSTVLPSCFNVHFFLIKFSRVITGLHGKPSHKMGFRSSVSQSGHPGEGKHEGLVPRNDVLTNGFI